LAIKDIRGEQMEPYIIQKRKYGEGELRIGYCLILNDSIYHYGFIINLKDEHIIKYMDILSGVVRKEGDEEGLI
jgi:hypothetical protein